MSLRHGGYHFTSEKCLNSTYWFELNTPFLNLVWHFATTNHIVEILFPNWFSCVITDIWFQNLRFNFSPHTFLPGVITCSAHLFLNSKTGCLLCSVKAANSRNIFERSQSTSLPREEVLGTQRTWFNMRCQMVISTSAKFLLKIKCLNCRWEKLLWQISKC